MKKIFDLIQKYYDILAYLFFGVLTTAVNYIVYLPCYNILHFSATISNVIAWVFAVVFAYLTNKPLVFRSYDWSAQTVIPEFTKFAGSRVFSLILVTVCIKITVEILGWNFVLMKIATSVLNIVLNYIASKLLVFRKK